MNCLHDFYDSIIAFIGFPKQFIFQTQFSFIQALSNGTLIRLEYSLFRLQVSVYSSAADDPSVSQSQRRPLLVESPTSAFTFKTLLRHYAKLNGH